LNGPLVVLLKQDRADKSEDGFVGIRGFQPALRVLRA
jgi:hypothetical protein